MSAQVPAIRVRHLWHRFGNIDVLRDVSFEVGHGEIFEQVGLSLDLGDETGHAQHHEHEQQDGADGETVQLKAGRPLGPVPAPSPLGTHVLSASSFREAVEPAARGAGAAWEALESLTGSDADWWPEDVPVLLGELEGGEGEEHDASTAAMIHRLKR